MNTKKVELEIGEEMFDFLLREGIRANIKDEFSDKKVKVLPPEWAEMLEGDKQEVDSDGVGDIAPLTAEELAEEDKAMGYFVAMGLEAILKDRFNSIEEEVAINENIETKIGISIH